MSEASSGQVASITREGWSRPALLLFFVVALALRHAVLQATGPHFQTDPDDYGRVAYHLVNHFYLGPPPRWQDESGPSAYRAPLYPMLVALGACVGDGIAAWHVLLGALTVVLVIQLGSRWGLSRSAALAAGTLVMFDPLLVQQSGEIMTETLATFLAAAAMLSLSGIESRQPSHSRSGTLRRVFSGALLGFCTLCRPVFLVWLVGCAAVMLLERGPLRRRAVRFGSLVLGALLVLSPWIIRNEIVFARPIVTTTHGGFTFWLANNPHFYSHLEEQGWFAPWDSKTAVYDQESDCRFRTNDAGKWTVIAFHGGTIENGELAVDAYCYADALDAIADQPSMFAQACCYRLSRLWGICPLAPYGGESAAHRWLRYAVAVGYALEFALAAWGAWLIGRGWLRTPWLWGLLLVGSFTVVHTFYWTDMRMRAPLTPVVALAAATGAANLARRLKRNSFEERQLAPTESAGNLP